MELPAVILTRKKNCARTLFNAETKQVLDSDLRSVISEGPNDNGGKRVAIVGRLARGKRVHAVTSPLSGEWDLINLLSRNYFTQKRVGAISVPIRSAGTAAKYGQIPQCNMSYGESYACIGQTYAIREMRRDGSARTSSGSLSMTRGESTEIPSLSAQRARQDYCAREKGEPLIRAFHLGKPLADALGVSHLMYLYVKACPKLASAH